MKLSVIIHIYSVEKHLEKCITSVLNQSYENIEILLVNDGSTDNSGEICNEFACNYPNIKVFHKENEGLSETRNFGVKNSVGEYVAFLDSDDFIFPGSYEKMMIEFTKHDVDIVVGKLVKYFPDDNKYLNKQHKDFSQCNTIISGKLYLDGTIRENIYTAVSVKGIYKKSLIIENNLFFEKGLLHEDELWSPKIFISAQKVIDTGEVFMHMFIEKVQLLIRKISQKMRLI